MNPRFRFRRIAPRDDIEEIRKKVTSDSVEFCGKGTWDTLYNDTYRAHPINVTQSVGAPPVSVYLGGGSFAPTREEMRSSYMNTYHKFDKTAIPPLAIKPKDSDVIAHDSELPRLSTAHAAMLESSQGPRGYDKPLSARLAADQRSKHFDTGYDSPNFSTTMGTSYSARGPTRRPVVDTDVYKRSSVVFDKNAGLGPHEKSLTKRRGAPACPDSAPWDQRQKNFDVGYNGDSWTTTTGSMFTGRSGGRPEIAQPPPCAEFANHGPHAPKWSTLYKDDYQQRKPIDNTIDTLALQRTHWDQGYEPRQWPVHEPPPTVKPAQPTENQQKSNIVFRGDGTMRCSTTTRDMLGQFDPTIDARRQPSAEGRKDNIMVGSDNPRMISTAQAANRLAGTGKPAESCADLYKMRGVGFARGGAWDPLAGKDPIDEKRYKPVEPTKRVDGRWYRMSHFDLDATNANKPRYTTTYYKTICEPTLESVK